MTTDSWLEAGALDGEQRLAGVELPVGVTKDSVALAVSVALWRRVGCRYGVKVHTDARYGRLYSGCLCDQTSYCTCPGLRYVDLGPNAVSVQAVKVDGVTLASSAYQLIGNDLWRQDGYLWPCCQSLNTPLGQVGTWSVSHTNGHAPPPDGVLAAREWAIHVALRLSQKDSKVPARARSISRKGVTIDLGVPPPVKGQVALTGIPLVDDFLLSANPHGLVRRSSVGSPDRVRRLSR